MLARNPAFTAVSVLTLALGIGATTAIFSFVNAVVLRPLRYEESDRLVMVLPAPRSSGSFRVTAASAGDFLEWQSQNDVFDQMAAFGGWDTPSLTGDGEPEGLLAANVTSRFFETLGVAPLIGRTFLSQERQPDASQGGLFGIARTRAVMISAALWRRRFASDPAVVGKSITLDGRPATVIGVMPPGFTFPQDIFTTMGARFTRDIELWTLVVPEPGYRANALLQVVARLKPGVTIDQAQADMATIAGRLEQQFPRNRGIGVRIVALQERVVHDVRPLLLLFLGAVGFLLLIACTNVANLLLGRGAARRKEVAIRAALGAGGWRLVRQFLTESVLLGLVGGVSGLLVAVWGLDLASRLVPPGSLPRLAEVTIDPHVLAFTLLVSFTTGLVFGAAPALQSSRTDVTMELKEAAPTHTAGSRFLSLLVVSEVALAFVLLVGAGLLIKSFVRLTSVDPGFTPERVLTLSVVLPEAAYESSAKMRAFSPRRCSNGSRMPRACFTRGLSTGCRSVATSSSAISRSQMFPSCRKDSWWRSRLWPLSTSRPWAFRSFAAARLPSGTRNRRLAWRL
jgi:putative ABC transport system permease protein